jgi:hypothetical protein
MSRHNKESSGGTGDGGKRDAPQGLVPHPYADLFPLMTEEELAALAADVKVHGLRQPIVRYQGKVLDGRNRLLACEKVGVEPRFEDFEGDDKAALAYVVSANLQRRDLTAGQRAVVAARVLQQRGGRWGGDRKSSANQVPTFRHLNRDSAAALFKVNKEYIQQAKTLVTDAPDLAERVAVGALPVSTAYATLQSRRAGLHARQTRGRATATATEGGKTGATRKPETKPEADAAPEPEAKPEAEPEPRSPGGHWPPADDLAKEVARELRKKMPPDDPIWDRIKLATAYREGEDAASNRRLVNRLKVTAELEKILTRTKNCLWEVNYALPQPKKGGKAEEGKAEEGDLPWVLFRYQNDIRSMKHTLEENVNDDAWKLLMKMEGRRYMVRELAEDCGQLMELFNRVLRLETTTDRGKRK